MALAAAGCGPSGDDAGTTLMNARLERIRAQALRDNTYPYFNRQFARINEGKLKDFPYEVVIPTRLDHAFHLLHGGETERCIVELEKVVQAAFPDGLQNKEGLPYFRLLALAYFRLGEQQNCLDQRDADACIIPAAGGGVHRLKAGSERAVDLYLRLLAHDPEDLESRWMLNLAYMTLGAYPDEVPARYLIPPSAFASEYSPPRFVDGAPAAGVDAFGHAGGCILDDFTGDGRLDLFVTSDFLTEPARFFVNNGDGTFTERTRAAGLEGLYAGLNCVQGDYDNDGLPDVFITRGAWLGHQGHFPNSLLKNLGGGRFADVTEAAGLLDFRPTHAAAWADFNRDGLLDLFVGHESTPNDPHYSAMYLNQGDGTFREVAGEVGLRLAAFVKGAVWGDVNNDGWPDLYVSVYGAPNSLFINREGRFEEVAAKAGVEGPSQSFSCWFFDYDNDGWEDIFVSGYLAGKELRLAEHVAADYLGLGGVFPRPRLYRNNGDGTFSDMTRPAGLDRALFAMGCNFGDLDNDGWLDFYLGTGELGLWSVMPNRVFRNDGGRRFLDVTTAGGFGIIQKGHGVAFGDVDDDGFQDIYTVLGGAVEGDVYYNQLLRNPGNANRWIQLILEGGAANRSAIGARVRVSVSEPGGGLRHIHRTVSSGGSFGANPLRLEIGLGPATRVDSLVIRWPDRAGSVERWGALELDRRYRVRQGAAPAAAGR
jgi:hypothetical protein